MVANVLSEHTYVELRNMVLNGKWRTGEPMSERELAARLSVSRMPVREALRKLEHDGLLQIVPFRGAFVRKLSAEEVRDIYEVRQAIEGMAAFLAAKRGVTAKLASFRSHFRKLQQTSDAAALRKAQGVGATFHVAIIQASSNPKLLAIAESLRSQIALTLNMALEHDPERVRASVAEHLAILNAIERRAAAESRERMVAHLASGLESRLHILSNLR